MRAFLAGIILVALGVNVPASYGQSAERNAKAVAVNGEQTATRQQGPPTGSIRQSGIAVVELFTSQGCNSCPPADSLLRQIDVIATQRNLPVFSLSFHVDYWNRLGWTDPYSDKLFSRRQSAYASAASSRRIYTPQMIVNGTTEFVGSNRAKAHAAINRSLGRVASSKVTIDIADPRSPRSVSVQYHIDGETEASVLNLAVIQSPQPNRVPVGENAGRELSHVNVVRAFRSIPLTEAEGNVSLNLPDGIRSTDTSVVAYVQNTKTLDITGAAVASAK